MISRAAVEMYPSTNFSMMPKARPAITTPGALVMPPMMATATDRTTGAYSIVTRDDGSRQWAYKGKPVYTYKADQKAGDTLWEMGLDFTVSPGKQAFRGAEEHRAAPGHCHPGAGGAAAGAAPALVLRLAAAGRRPTGRSHRRHP
eukprot:gene49121-60126_t